MKSVRIASGIKHIEETDPGITLFRIQEILSEHRSHLIAGVLSGLPTYLQFKFYIKVDNETQAILRERLSELASSKVNLDRYADIVQEIKSNDSFRVSSSDFFREIDTVLDTQLNPMQLQLI